MCARYSLTKEEITMIIGVIEIVIKIKARYNIAPRQMAPVIANAKGGGPETREMEWGWQPAWSKTLLINAQAENITTKPTFQKFFDAGQRCLIPADGFYEWLPDKTPIRFTKPGNEPFCFAGLYLESKSTPLDVEVTRQKFIIITTTPNETVQRVHNRMPLIVKPDHYNWWLEEGMAGTVLKYPDHNELQWCPVQKSLNNVRNEGPELIRPFVQTQGDLF